METGAGGWQNLGPPGIPVAKTNGKAVASLILGILGMVVCGLVLGIPAIVLGVMGAGRFRLPMEVRLVKVWPSPDWCSVS
jgi:hypothetical protein